MVLKPVRDVCTMSPMFAFMAVETDIPWPQEEMEIAFDGRSIRIRPGTDTRRADIAVEYGSGESLEDAVCIGNAFLSQLSWQTKMPIRVDQYCGASFPMSGISKLHSQHISSHFKLDFRPLPKTKRQRLALALFREAQGNKSVPYAVLGFYKIIKLLFPNDKKGQLQMEWIRNNVKDIKDFRAKSRLKELADSGEEVGKYIYVDVRCAIAHANQAPTVNPDDSKDLLQLHNDLPLVEALARIAIESEFEIKSDQTFREEHKYELKGFRPLLDSRLVKQLKKKPGVSTNVPRFEVSIKMRDKAQLSAFQHLVLKQIDSPTTGAIRLMLTTADGLVRVLLVLETTTTRLLFNPIDGVTVHDDGSITAIKYEMDRNTMVIDWLRNGATEVYSIDGNLLGRSDPFIPHNIDFNATLQSFHEAIESLRTEYSKRFFIGFGGK